MAWPHLGQMSITVGGVDGGLLGHDAALLVLSGGLHGLLDDGHALDDNLALSGKRAQDSTPSCRDPCRRAP